ncbi:MAG TPA: PQQ-dependent sugar dehydrogenase [Blastocatellia bacterium]|nr:PQQ-dependent sugar dehydrogenase [Blastocatellia bacterium]
MLKSSLGSAAKIFAVILLAFALISFSPRTNAQLRQVIIAPGFEFNVFASTANVPDFAVSAFAGPTAMAFDSRGRLFVATLSGRILILLDNDDDGRLDQIKTYASGITQPLGIEFRADGDLFVTSNRFGGAGRIMRLRDLDGDDVAEEISTIVDGLPSEGDHQTDRLKFGPDGLLYFGQGSSTDNGVPKENRPPERQFNATILRIDINNPAITQYASGLRNPFGMAFHPENGELFSTDGGSGEVCQIGDCGGEDLAPPEEINWVVASGNYGFPQCEGTPTPERPGCQGVRGPVTQFPRHLTPTSIAFYTGPQAGEFKNEMLVTLFKNLANQENLGGDLRRLKLEGSASEGFRVTDNQFIAQFDPIDPFDGPVDTAIDPISGDIYVARLDTVTHRDINEHHHIIYRIHREGSDLLPFIGPVQPSAFKAGSGDVTIKLIGRHIKAGAIVFADGAPLVTRQGANQFELVADVPEFLTATERTITIEARLLNGARSNQQTLSITRGDPDPDPVKSPQITSMFVFKKKRSKVISPVTVVPNAKKFRLVVAGTDFDSGAQLIVNGVTLAIESASATELVGRFPKTMLAAPGELNVQVRNSTGRTSAIVKINVVQ